MADEKKPKIDLKARLGKAAVGGATPPPPGAGGIPVPQATPSPSGGSGNANATGANAPIAPGSQPKAGLPVPPGIPVGPPPAFKAHGLALDPSNPLAAAVAPPAAQRSVKPPQPQRI